MNETKFVMLDIETLDVRPSSHILQVSAIAFDLKKHKEASFSMNVDYAGVERKYPNKFTTGEKTLKFWESQPRELWEDIQSNKKPLDEVLKGFSEFYKTVKEKGYRKIWCHCDFDIPILKYAYDVCGIMVPWNFKDRLDIRTIVLTAGINLDDYDWKKKTHIYLSDF